MKTYVFILAAFFIGFSANAQLSESFSDQDFTANPFWFGSSSSWTVVPNSDAGAGAALSNTLRLNAFSGDVTDYLSTQIPGSWGQEQSWSFWIGRRAQAATASNVSFVWLYANEAKANNTTVDGYRLRFGDDLPGGDRIVLESVVDGSASPFINSAGSVPNGLTDYGFMVRITRTSAGLWTLYTSPLPTVSGSGAIATDDPSSAANTFVMQGASTNTVITQFNDGYISVGAYHTASPAARTGVEFDQISLSAVGNSTLPVRWGDFSLRQARQGVLLSWTNLSESDVLYYQTQRSADGQNFSPLSTIYPTGNSGGAASYNYLDAPAPPGMTFYRIAARDNGGQINYTRILRTGTLPANASNSGPGAGWNGMGRTNRAEAIGRFNARVELKLYPNPVSGSEGLQLMGNDYPKGVYNLFVYDNDGRKLYGEELVHEGGVFRASVRLGSISRVPVLKVPPGLYHLILRGPVTAQKSFVVQ